MKLFSIFKRRWRTIESYPKDECPVVLISEGGFITMAYFDRDQDVWMENTEDFWGNWKPTHWMPLPIPPKVGGER